MSIQSRLNDLVKSGYSATYIESILWASYSRNYSINQIASMVAEAKPQ